ncbi:hypothetical protein UFOVP847_45 [uncultured Caudovirales phage]|uniref:Uncharacterized protein n=1 Tax=uncultured Caudovirales phage TaxID=2100421 RepID=A0A6J5PBR6_9CAUD|nr:hypothetical protein UFOVP847_45 [uncultured Caudovirales phage]
MSIQPSTREQDECLLLIVKMRRRHGPLVTADELSLPSERVRVICNRIMNDDLKYSTKDNMEAKQQVMAGYWRK